ncbi:uncharacterized protein LOC134472692 [Cavia porcellus]|uniref:uncharacterized protein LOC134472692 n=1 Tax=Cavia porcellus TaxID=10141 RepID=UPI002FDF2990
MRPQTPHSCTRRPREESGDQAGSPSLGTLSGQRKKPFLGTSPCCAPALSSQLLLETQPSLQLPALGSCRTRRRLEPSTQLLRPRAPRAHPPPAPGARRSPRFTRSSFPTSSFPLFHLLQAHLPLPESQLQRVSGLRMRRSAGAGGCRSSGPRNPRLLSNISPPKEALRARGSLLVLPAPGVISLGVRGLSQLPCSAISRVVSALS